MSAIVDCDGCGQSVESFETDGDICLCLTCTLVLDFEDIKAQLVSA